MVSPLSEAELSQYCWKKGLYPGQVRKWKDACATAHPQQEQEEKQQREAKFSISPCPIECEWRMGKGPHEMVA